MNNNLTLTNDEIHAIRVEHSKRTKDLPFEDYRKQLDAEITPTLHKLEELKKTYTKK